MGFGAAGVAEHVGFKGLGGMGTRLGGSTQDLDAGLSSSM